MTADEHARLSRLAAVVGARRPNSRDDLTRELERAEVVALKHVGPATVTMGSQVEFAYRGSGIRQTVTLVFPPDADIAKRKVSILTAVRTALIGLSEGQSIAFCTPCGQERTIIVLKVRRPEISDGGDEHPKAGSKVIPIGGPAGRARRRLIRHAEPIEGGKDPGPSAA